MQVITEINSGKQARKCMCLEFHLLFWIYSSLFFAMHYTQGSQPVQNTPKSPWPHGFWLGRTVWVGCIDKSSESGEVLWLLSPCFLLSGPWRLAAPSTKYLLSFCQAGVSASFLDFQVPIIAPPSTCHHFRPKGTISNVVTYSIITFGFFNLCPLFCKQISC